LEELSSSSDEESSSSSSGMLNLSNLVESAVIVHCKELMAVAWLFFPPSFPPLWFSPLTIDALEVEGFLLIRK
jgi:hypothetical protein